MKNKGLTVVAIILLSAAALLLAAFLAAYLNGARFWGGALSSGAENGGVIFDEAFPADGVKIVEIRAAFGDVFLKESSDENIRAAVYGKSKGGADVRFGGGRLSVSCAGSRRFALSDFFNFGAEEIVVEVYLPPSFAGKIKVNNGYGKCEAADFQDASVDIGSDAGGVEIGRVKDAAIRCDYGNVRIKEVLNRCDIKADFGNIEIERLLLKEDSAIRCDFGNVDIGATNDIYIEAKVDFGNAKIKKNERSARTVLKITCGCGNITVG